MSRFTLEIQCEDVDGFLDLTDEYTVEEIEESIDEWCQQGDYTNPDGDGCEVEVGWKVFDDGDEVESGSHLVQFPDDEKIKIEAIGGNSDCDHEWEPDESVGCKENPGVMGLGGTALSVTEWCTECRIVRTTRHNGVQRNPGQPKIEVSFGWYLEDDKEYQQRLAQE